MKTLHISVADKKATYRERDGSIVCGNSDYEIEFAFDSEWDAYTEKTARFIWNGAYVDQKFTGTTCSVPIVWNATSVEVGVYAGELSTTTSAYVPAVRCVLDGSAEAHPEGVQEYRDEAARYADAAKVSANTAQAAANKAAEEASIAAAESVAVKIDGLALKGSASGKVIRVDDVAPGEYPVKVKVGGKNLLNPDALVIIGSGTFTVADDSITFPASSEIYGVKCAGSVLKVGETYTFSIGDITDYKAVSWGWRLQYEDGTYSLMSMNKVFTLAVSKPVSTIMLYVGVPYTGNKEIIITNPMLELGDTATGYEPYVDPSSVRVTRYGATTSDNSQTYTPNADGTVDGVMSLYPTMHLVTGNAYAILDVEYNRDINAALENVSGGSGVGATVIGKTLIISSASVSSARVDGNILILS